MKVFIPPLKCQGIKTKLVPWILGVAPAYTGRWIEPFLGSGVVGFNSGAEEAVLNDINPHIIRFYRMVQSSAITADLVGRYLLDQGERLSSSADAGYAHYRFIRERFNRDGDPLDFLFLSRAGFNGMMRFSRKGGWNIPFCKKPDRFRPSYITRICNQIRNTSALIKQNWKLLNGDFREVVESARGDDLIYCDPPYAGRYADYYSGWTEKDEAELCSLLTRTRARFILSSWHHNPYRENESIRKRWSGFNIVTRDHFYHSGAREENRKPVVEALICNFAIAGAAGPVPSGSEAAGSRIR